MIRKRLVLVGAGGHGYSVLDIARSIALWDEYCFLDDSCINSKYEDCCIMGKISDASHFLETSDYIVTIGNNAIRQRVQNELQSMGAKIATVISPQAIIGSGVVVGKGSVVMPGVVLTCDVTVGEGCIINTAASVDHESVIGDYVHISPGVHLAGRVNVKNLVWIGIGASVIQDVVITDKCIIGAGAAVIRSIDQEDTYVGVPARRIDRVKNIDLSK